MALFRWSQTNLERFGGYDFAQLSLQRFATFRLFLGRERFSLFLWR